MTFWLVFLLSFALIPAQAQQPTLAIVNAHVWTGNPAQPWAEAISAIKENITAVPGFIDSHVHFLDGGFRLDGVLLRNARTQAEFIARIKVFAATIPTAMWITAGDWGHRNWGGELPDRSVLSDPLHKPLRRHGRVDHTDQCPFHVHAVPECHQVSAVIALHLDDPGPGHHLPAPHHGRSVFVRAVWNRSVALRDSGLAGRDRETRNRKATSSISRWSTCSGSLRC